MVTKPQVRVSPHTHDAVRAMAVGLALQLGRPVSLTRTLSAAVRVAARHPQEHHDAARVTTDGGGGDTTAVRVDLDAHELLLGMSATLGGLLQRPVNLREALAVAVVVAGHHTDELPAAVTP